MRWSNHYSLIQRLCCGCGTLPYVQHDLPRELCAVTAMTFGQKQFIPTPPDKGSFPLDHDGACKKTMTKYMKCLFDNNSNNSMCRDEAKSYLACRMDNNLMAKEDWSKLGFQESDDSNQIKESTRQ